MGRCLQGEWHDSALWLLAIDPTPPATPPPSMLLPHPPATPHAPTLRLQLLMAEVHQLSGDVSQALVVATETVRHCAEHNWKDLVVQGKLLIVQLQVS